MDHFKLHSEYKPTGDQPQAIEYLSKGIEEGKKFTVNIKGDIGVGIFDENRLKQVLNNVIDNSFKFTEKNGRININANRNENILKLIKIF